MSFINKVKNFFYEDVDGDYEEPKTVEKKKFNPFKKEPKFEEEPKVVEEVKDVKQEANNDLSERELFRAERTFNFPMDMGDDIFDKEEKEEVKEETPYVRKEPVKETTYTRSIYHNISREEPKRPEEKKKFKPTPVISPVYGVLDKNYTVDDVVDADKTKEFSLDKKIVDFDSVRNRAYKDLDEELEKTMNTEVFYNLDEEENDDSKESVIITYDEAEEPAPVVAEEVEFKDVEIPEVKVSSIEETEDESEEDDDLAPDVKIEVPKRTRRSRTVASVIEETEKKDKEEKEDLFNLIDNMYNEDDEEEE